MLENIEYCKECGLHTNDIEGNLRGVKDTCITCGGLEDWLVVCTCGNDSVYDDFDQYTLAECPKCSKPMNEGIISHFCSGYVIMNVLKRPDLHKELTWIPASFVETLIQSNEANK